jgi:hypothetical protein
MNSKEALGFLAELRASNARQVLNTPERYKICETCFSLVPRSDALCPFCQAYRFNTNVENVIKLAKLLGNRPMAFQAAIIPRGTTALAMSYG